MRPSPSISVLTAVYNGTPYLREAIDSILNQTFSDFEFIIINDGSTDETAEILSSYTDPRIRIIKNSKNLGLTKSLNIGLKIARGIYIARMDADDIALPERLQIEKKFLDNHLDIVAVGSEIDLINEDGKKVGEKHLIQYPEIIRFRMVIANQLAHPTILFRKSIIIENGGYDEHFKYAQDYELWSRLNERNYHFSNIAASLLRYRDYPKSMTQGAGSRDQAYASAVAVIRRNLSHYMMYTEEELLLFLKSFHKHQVDSFWQAVTVRNFWSRFKKAYFKKETISLGNKVLINKYVSREQLGAFRWYTKWRFGILYKIAVKIWKLKNPS